MSEWSNQTNPGDTAWMAVHDEPDGLWAECPRCPGFSCAAATFDELYRLAAEHHASLTGAESHGWSIFHHVRAGQPETEG